MSRNSMRNQNIQNSEYGSDGNGGGGIVDIPGRIMGEGGGINAILGMNLNHIIPGISTIPPPPFPVLPYSLF